jgi:hypothetical protein
MGSENAPTNNYDFCRSERLDFRKSCRYLTLVSYFSVNSDRLSASQLAPRLVILSSLLKRRMEYLTNELIVG